ncbi:hypothetical protein PVAND_016634 [Polypedilum vanderplanki]|uniref:Peptidase S1 domain-containing protein n=1 Tax=Polypedilum vanderplanki TaxID=319348 RepID=A0A9J6BFN0_POLVA|nr:hypothetical protein PVAND_016634 [Polypedilum vanderplanki]
MAFKFPFLLIFTTFFFFVQAERDHKIVGGSTVDISSYPFMVSVQNRGRHICGGSIIKPRYALTAAHCLYGGSASSFSVRSDTSFRNMGGRLHKAKSIKINPQYNSKTHDYDSGVIEIGGTFSANPVQLATVLPSSGSSVTAIGWGELIENGPLPFKLQAVGLNLISQDQCSRYYRSHTFTARMICAGVNGGGKDTCQGDSGGPLISNGNLIGITSFGIGCARANYPGVYSNVPSLYKWINDATP